MGQQDIIEFLRSKRATSDDYFTTFEIAKGIKNGSSHYSAVRKALFQLVRMGIVETKNAGDVFEWIKTFRLNKKYLEEK